MRGLRLLVALCLLALLIPGCTPAAHATAPPLSAALRQRTVEVLGGAASTLRDSTESARLDASAASAAALVASKRWGPSWKPAGIVEARLTQPNAGLQDRLAWIVAFQAATPDGSLDTASDGPFLVLVIDAQTGEVLESAGT